MLNLDIIILIIAFAADWYFGDPKSLPHLIVGYGKGISLGESLLNQGNKRILKGAILCLSLVALTFAIPFFALNFLADNGFIITYVLLSSLLLFYCLANRTLIDECMRVNLTLEQEGLIAGRLQVARIVGRETNELSENEVRAATLETMSENLSDGVIAPLFYFLLFGVPGAMAYKMVNTLDSMIGYHNDKYQAFGKVSARLDDLANFIPARLTALLMLISQLKINGVSFVFTEARKHKSPNAGYPEAALAYLLNCQLGGPATYQGMYIEKAFIGNNKRTLTGLDIKAASKINLQVSIIFVAISAVIFYAFNYA